MFVPSFRFVFLSDLNFFIIFSTFVVFFSSSLVLFTGTRTHFHILLSQSVKKNFIFMREFLNLNDVSRIRRPFGKKCTTEEVQLFQYQASFDLYQIWKP